MPESKTTLARFRAKLKSGGRIQIPKEVRGSEDLDDGDYVDVVLRRVMIPEGREI